MKRTTAKPNRLNRKDASADEERRRMVEKLCMFNSYQCVGAVHEYPHSGRSFGESFVTTALLCAFHHERMPVPHKRNSAPPPENQSPQGRTRCYVIGQSIVKNGQGGKYREAYDVKKAYYEAERLDWAQGRRHNAAMRYAVKELVKDAWVEWRSRVTEAA